MNRALGHLCAHIGLTGPREPPEDGEMIEMTLSSRHRKETFLFFSNRRDPETNPELWRERQRC